MTRDSPCSRPATSPADIRAAAQVRRRFRQAQLAMGRALAGVNLTALQYHLMLEVAAAGPEGLAQRVLAGRLSAPEARISALVQPLLERGLIRASRSAPDRRVVRIRLTRSGASLLAQALEAQRQALVELVRSIPSDEMAAMVEWGMKEYLRLPE